MPFDGEYATGESLLSLEQSEAFRKFVGQVRPRAPKQADRAPVLPVERDNWIPRRVIAIDGSNVSTALDNGFPMAELTLLKVAVVSIDISRLLVATEDDIPSPRAFYEMERASTFDQVLPGANVIHPDVPGDTPRRYFRRSAYDAFLGRMDAKHETLLETVRAIVGGPHAPARPPGCPVDDCDQTLKPGRDAYRCDCERAEELFETDAFRFAERFSEVSSNGEAHGEVRHVMEIVSLLNILRFFARDSTGLSYLRDNVFVIDGPLALFGHPAWLTPYVRRELMRIGELCRAQGFEPAVFGYEKSGAFVDHFERLDHCAERGPRGRYPPRTALGLDAAYVNRNVTLRPANAKPHGQDTYFGRKLLYKTASGEHAVITTAMTNSASLDFRRASPDCHPRLGHTLNVLDHLATYLYQDGFMPLVRAHAHAAIPLGRGADMLRGLFGNGPTR